MRVKTAIFGFLILSQWAFCQDKPQTETWAFGFRISSIEKTGPSLYRATLDHGADVGLTTKVTANVYGRLSQTVAKHNRKLGKAVFTEVLATQSRVELTLNDKEEVFEGDLVYVSLSLPKKKHTPYFYLIKDAIEVVKDDGTPYYTFKEVFEKDSYPLRTEKFVAMSTDARAMGEKLKQSEDKTKVQAGPNGGDLLSEVLIKSDTGDIWRYLYHLSQIDWETMGQTIRLSDGFRAFVEEGDMASPAQLKLNFTGITKASLDRKYNYYKRKIDKKLLDGWKTEAVELRNKGEYAEAEDLITLCIVLAVKNNSFYDAGVYAYSLGELFDEQKLYEKSIAPYQLALKYFKQEKSDFATAYAYNNLAVAYYRQEKYDSSGKYYKGAIEVRAKMIKEDPKVETMNSFYTSTDGLASVLLAKEENEKALELYKGAVLVAQSAKNRSNEGSAIWNMAYTYGEKLKNYSESYTYYKQAMDIQLELQDTADAIVLVRSTAIMLKNLGKWDQAKAQVREGIILANSWGKKPNIAYILDYQGQLLYEANDYAGSVKSYLEAEALYTALKENKKLESVKKKMAVSYREDRKYDACVAKNQERFALIDPTDLSSKADIEWAIAYAYGAKKDHKSEVQHYQVAEKLYIQLKDSSNLSTVMNNIGYAFRDARDSVNSYKWHEKAIAFDKIRKKKDAIANSYEHLANSYKAFKNYSKAIANFREAQQYYYSAGNFLKAGKMLDDQGERYSEKKQFQQSATAYKDAVQIYREASLKKEEASSRWNYAYQIGENLKDFDAAIIEYRTAYDIYIAVADSISASTMLSNIGQTYWSKVNYAKAIEAHEAAVALANKCRNQQQVASSWTKLASLYKQSNNPVASANALVKALEALQTVNDSTMLATTYQALGNNYVNSKEYPKAVDYFDRSIVIFKKRKDTLNWASAVSDYASMYSAKNEYKNSEKLYLEAIALRKNLKDKDAQVYSMAGLANLELNVATNYLKAEKYFLEAEKLAKESKNEYMLAYTYGQMKWLYRSEGKAALAEASVKKAYDLFKKNNFPKDLAYAITSMAHDAGYVNGDQVKALKILADAEVIADTLKDFSLQAYVLAQKGAILREMGEFKESLELSDKSFDLYKKMENEWGLASVYIDKGNTYKIQSEYELALKSQMSADSIFLVMHNEYSRLAPIANIGENYAAMGDYPKAMEYYQKAYAIMQKAKDLNENLGIIQGLMGEAYFYMNNFPEAEKWLKASLVTCDQVGAMRPKSDNLAVIGRLKLESKKYDEARTYLSEGMKISKEKTLKLAYLNNLVLMGKLEVEQKHYEQAGPVLEECVKTSKEVGKANTLWESLYWQGVMSKAMGQLPKAKEQLIQSVEVIEKIRNKVSGGEEARKLFSSDKHIMSVYEALVAVLLELGETELAMSYLQKNNEDNLKEKFKGLDIKFQDETKNEVIDKERGMKAKLDGIEQQISKEKALPVQKQNAEKIKNLEGIQTIAETNYLKFVNEQVNVQPELQKFFSNSAKPLEFKKQKKYIPKDMALLSYLPGESNLYLFIVTTDTVIAKVVNVTRQQLTKEVTAVINIVKNNQGTLGKLDLQSESQERQELVNEVLQKDPMMKPFEELYHYLIAPAAEEIASKKKLCIIPNGSLSYIPFQLLGKTLKNGKFSLLANQFAIFYANSTDMLQRVMVAEDKTYNIVAFGNPDKSLPSTEKEVNDIKILFPSATVYTGESATEDKAKFVGEKFNVMHFATHGNLDYEDFSKSYLTMAVNPAKQEDGRLTLEELWGMDAMNHLNIVVLSACQTAVTKGSNESSPVSPASGFLQNGVRSVVATLWKVDDEATSLLIGDFYKNLKTMDAVDALRLAQVNLSNNPKFTLPYYWAGAILMGDWR